MTGDPQHPAATLRRDPYLWFPLFGVPRPVYAPIAAQLEEHSIDQLSCTGAASVIEGIVYLQWIKSAIIGFLVLILLYATDTFSGAARAGEEAIGFSLLMWTPIYMLLICVPWLAFKRTKFADTRLAVSRPGLLSFLRRAPLIAIPLTLTFGVLMA